MIFFKYFRYDTHSLLINFFRDYHTLELYKTAFSRDFIDEQ